MSTNLLTNSTKYLKQINNKVCNPKNMVLPEKYPSITFFCTFLFYPLRLFPDSALSNTAQTSSQHRPRQCRYHLCTSPDSAGIISAPALTVQDHLCNSPDSAGLISAPALTVRELSLHRPWQCGDHLGNGPDSAGITSAPALTVRVSSLHRPWQNFSALLATSQRSSLSCPR